MDDITVRNSNIGDFAVLEVFMDDGVQKKPLIILFHGWSGKKEDCLNWGRALAKDGFFVACADAYNHGERKCQGFFSTISDTIIKTADEVNLIIEKYTDSNEADAERTGLAGISMGGNIALYYLTMKDRRIKAAASAITSPDWALLLNRPLLVSVFKEVDPRYTEEIIADEVELAKHKQPINKYEAMNGIPLLLMQGETDELVPVESVKNFYNLLHKVFYDKEALKLMVYPGTGHAIIHEMDTEVISWFKKYL